MRYRISSLITMVILGIILYFTFPQVFGQTSSFSLVEKEFFENNQRKPTITEALATFTLQTKSENLSTEAYNAAKIAIIDAIGVSLAGHDATGIESIVSLLKTWGGKPEATVWVYGEKLPVPDVSFINGSIVHALDYDHNHNESNSHLMSTIFPVAMAVGESIGASGKEVMDAIIIGTEVAGRLGFNYLKKEFLPTSIIGGFASTAAACRLKNLNIEETTDAMGIFYAHASGNRQALLDRTTTKRLQAGIGARSAVFSAYLAAQGIDGAVNVFEGESGLMAAYGVRDGVEEIIDRLTQKRSYWSIEKFLYKSMTTCGHSLRLIQSAIDIANQYNLKISEIDQIELFGLETHDDQKMVTFPWNPNHRFPEVLAQFCAPYQVVSAIKNRRYGPDEVAEERVISDKEVSELAEHKVFIRTIEEYGENYPGGNTIRIRTKSGDTYIHSRELRNLDGVLYTIEEKEKIIQKFKHNVGFFGLSQHDADEIINAVENLEQYEDIGDFIEQYLVFGN